MIRKKSRSIAAVLGGRTTDAACGLLQEPDRVEQLLRARWLLQLQRASASPSSVALTGTITFNQSNLAKLDAALKAAMKGKSLSAVNIAMVVERRRRLLEGWSGRFPEGLRRPGPCQQQVHLLRPAERQAERAGLRTGDLALPGHYRLLDLRDRPGGS